jgi:hypothetical protein
MPVCLALKSEWVTVCYKIDASYLSPNVNMANRLEAGTKIYGIPLLLTG